jgi:hypothetical protein
MKRTAHKKDGLNKAELPFEKKAVYQPFVRIFIAILLLTLAILNMLIMTRHAKAESECSIAIFCPTPTVTSTPTPGATPSPDPVPSPTPKVKPTPSAIVNPTPTSQAVSGSGPLPISTSKPTVTVTLSPTAKAKATPTARAHMATPTSTRVAQPTKASSKSTTPSGDSTTQQPGENTFSWLPTILVSLSLCLLLGLIGGLFLFRRLLLPLIRARTAAKIPPQWTPGIMPETITQREEAHTIAETPTTDAISPIFGLMNNGAFPPSQSSMLPAQNLLPAGEDMIPTEKRVVLNFPGNESNSPWYKVSDEPFIT